MTTSIEQTITSLQARREVAKEKGFTLVELAIVLVIIGLIIGGVLVGQDLIKAAEVRATISQIEKYNSAVNTFRNKFNGIPGDIRNPGTFGLFALAGTDGQGDGDRRLEGGAANNNTTMAGEIIAFWRHLSEAQLVDGSFTTGGTAIDTNFPRAKIDRGGILVYFTGGYNYFHIGASATGTAVATLTAQEAYNIDQKLDDGNGNAGQVLAVGSFPTSAIALGLTAGGATATDCDTAAGVYNAQIAGVSGEAPVCQLALRMN
jgi:prepilin-type N-terminal cleavage/methylation domain-containing protein